ncbi:MAG TPA: hydroxyacid dehydrogenase [Roseiflexaceae bacterium]|nr:hydroxyacid dehydrogenase [Roseiflexaceae bacterium]HMP43055.1 hydroxyacid dehydrogenase [Roseiflexaceae bacterium]
MRIWTDARLHSEAQAIVRSYGELILGGDMALLPGAAAAIVSSLARVDGAFMDMAGPQLWAIARPGIGYDNIDVAAATQRGILVMNTPDAPTESTAEHAVALLLALAKRVTVGQERLRTGFFSIEGGPGMELRGRTIGLIGFGRIGRRVAQICSAGLLMRVLAYDPFTDWSHTGEGVTPVHTLEALLGEADIVSLHTALTPQTRQLIGARELALMRPGAVLINVSRGPVIDEAALLTALRNGHIGGAGLDVYDPEPPDGENPLLFLPNVVVTPHIATYTDAAQLNMGRGAAEQVGRVLHGERPPSLVNPEAWPGRTGS